MTRPLTAEEAMERASELELGPGWVVQDGDASAGTGLRSFRWSHCTEEPEPGETIWVDGEDCEILWTDLGPGSPNPDGWRETKRHVEPQAQERKP